MQDDEERERHRVVIRRVTFAYVTQEVFIHEVEPEESFFLARVRRAFHQTAGIAQAVCHVPRGGDQ
jgi:hypothetical protein